MKGNKFFISKEKLLLAPLYAIIISCSSISEQRELGSISNSVDTTPKTFELKTFAEPGPYRYQFIHDFPLNIGLDQRYVIDVFLPQRLDQAPLAIIQHGNGASKEAHKRQGQHLASWGINVITVSQPNKGQWLENGYRLRKLVSFLTRWPDILANRFDVNKIILVGHSFGGSAASLAAAGNTKIDGLVLLDPALYNSSVIKALKNVNVPTILLGADEDVFISKRRASFFSNIPKIIEVSLLNATHNDAQYPSQTEVNYFLDWETSTTLQQRFTAALTQAVFMLAQNKAWSTASKTYAKAARKGLFKEVKSKDLISKNSPNDGIRIPQVNRNSNAANILKSQSSL